MKKYIIGLAVSLAAVSTSCSDPLDVEYTGYYSEKTAYASLNNLDMLVKNYYSMLHSYVDIETGAGLTSINDGVSDILKASWYNVNGGIFNKLFFLDNQITVDNGDFRSSWSGTYSYIRSLNQFLYDYERGYIKLPREDVEKRVAEIRMIRAICYMELIQRHGGVILRLVDGHVDSVDENNKARSSEADSYDFVIKECDECANMLPASWPSEDLGRMTKSAAYALKARASLYAKRWDDAIAAVNDIVDLGVNNLVQCPTAAAYEAMFTSPTSKEIILPILYVAPNRQHSWNTWVGPLTDCFNATAQESFGAGITPTEEYVSQFDIKVGQSWEKFDWDNLAKYGNEPYKNRDPRFYYSILYQGADWRGYKIDFTEGRDAQMEYTGLPTSDNVHRTTTGYLIRKFLTKGTYNYTNTLSDQLWPEFRMAEMYLIRSESYARKGEWGKAYSDLNDVRSRVGLTGYAQTNNWDNYLADLQKERICELGIEGHRYFDIVRWGLDQQLLNGQRVHGIKITKVGTTLNYEVIDCDKQDRKFPHKYTICPIPRNEVQNNVLCEQNELWK